MRLLLALLAAVVATPSSHLCPLGGTPDRHLGSPWTRAALDADDGDAAGRISLIQRASVVARAPAFARPHLTKGVAPWARTGLGLALLAKSQGVASDPSGTSSIPGSFQTAASGAKMEEELVPVTAVASSPSGAPRIHGSFQTTATGANLESTLVPATNAASGLSGAPKMPGSFQTPAAGENLEAELASASTSASGPSRAPRTPESVHAPVRGADLEAELAPATTPAAGLPPNSEDAAEIPEAALTMELMPGTTWTSGEASEESTQIRKEDAAVLAESATALREGVRRSGQILRENTEIRREDTRLRLEEAEIRKEMLQLRHEDSELRRQNSQLRHLAESSHGAETGFHLPGVAPNHTVIAMITISVVVLGLGCYISTLVYDYSFSDEHTALPDTDNKKQDVGDVRAQVQKAHHGPEMFGISTGFLRSLVWIWLITAGGFSALWWMGVMQPFLKELLVWVYLISALCMIVALIIAQGAAEFAALHNALEMMFKVVRRIDGIIDRVFADAGKMFDEEWKQLKKDQADLNKLEKEWEAKLNLKRMFSRDAVAQDNAQSPATAATAATAADTPPADGGDATGSKGKGRSKVRRAGSCCT
mmetsp:Transcript_22303/g.47476  ORF Transcript_22303/g.47476 Transcript_22303/m.47476 type:complete len:596 (+) Transcript_22303:122-1909(+)